MKYIRTKDGNIYEIKYLTRHSEDSYSLGGFVKTGDLLIAIKESDNIEDLLDETVAFYKDGTKFHWGTFPIEEVISFYRVRKNKEAELDYLGGYIWDIKDNLIKVAELTDEGWELL
jgi:hypothetical protein